MKPEMQIRRESARQAALAFLYPHSPEVIYALADSLARLDDPWVRQGVLEALATLDGSSTLNEAWAAWAQNRHPDLEALLVQKTEPAHYPPLLRTLSLLRLGHGEALRDTGPEGIEPLLSAAGDTQDDISAQARAVLRGLRDPAAQEEVCRWVIEYDHPEARQAALEAGYAPAQARQRALFFLLAGQWERYEALDFDSSLAQAVYEAGDPVLRQKLAEAARRSGWAGYVDAVAGGRTQRRLEDLSPAEWEVVRAILSRHHDWEQIWGLAQAAPSVWSARLLHTLSEYGWASPGESGGSLELQRLAHSALAAGPHPEKMVRLQPPLVGHARQVTALAFNSKGSLLATGSADRTARIWKLPEGKLLHTLEGHGHYLLSLAFQPGGDLLATGSADKTVRLWQAVTGELARALPPQANEAAALAASPDGRLLASGDRGVIRVWSLPEGSLAYLLKGRMGQVTSLAFTPGSELLVSQDTDQSVQVWSLASGEQVGSLMESAAAWALGSEGLLASASRYGRARLWKLPAAGLLSTLKGHLDGNLLACSPDGRWLAGSDRDQVRVWPAGEEEARWSFSAGSQVTALTFSSDSRLLAAGMEAQKALLWQMPEGRLLAEMAGLRGPVRRLAFSPDGGLLAGIDENVVRLWALDDLGRFWRTPSPRLSPAEARRMEEIRRDPEVSSEVRAWLDFTLALVEWNRRFDIEVAEAGQLISIGEFDIELAGPGEIEAENTYGNPGS